MQRTASGHIPLNEATFAKMNHEERAFWYRFLNDFQFVIDDEVGKGTAKPFPFPEHLREIFQTAVGELYEGDKYCQVAQIRQIFGMPV